MTKEFLEEYKNQLNNFSNNEEYDIQDFIKRIITDKNNNLNKMMFNMDIESEIEKCNDDDINLLFESYLAANDADMDNDLTINNISKKYLKREDTSAFCNLASDKYKTYTNEEELEIFKKYNETEDSKEKIKIKQEIVVHNIKLVKKIATKYKTVSNLLTIDDIISYGTEGLMIAVEKFDYKMGYKFSTYASWWIMQVITREVNRMKRTVRLPDFQITRINKIRSTTDKLAKLLGRMPKDEELAKELDMTVDELNSIRVLDDSCISLNSYVGEDNDTSLEDILVVEQDNADDIVERKSTHDLMINTIIKVSSNKRDEIVMLMRFGFEPYNRCYTLEEIGNEFNLTRERVRQIEAKMLHRIKNRLEKIERKEKIKMI